MDLFEHICMFIWDLEEKTGCKCIFFMCRLSHGQCHHSSDRWRAAWESFPPCWEGGEREQEGVRPGEPTQHLMGQMKHWHLIYHHFHLPQIKELLSLRWFISSYNHSGAWTTGVAECSAKKQLQTHWQQRSRQPELLGSWKCCSWKLLKIQCHVVSTPNTMVITAHKK